MAYGLLDLGRDEGPELHADQDPFPDISTRVLFYTFTSLGNVHARKVSATIKESTTGYQNDYPPHSRISGRYGPKGYIFARYIYMDTTVEVYDEQNAEKSV